MFSLIMNLFPLETLGFTGINKNNYKLSVYSKFTFFFVTEISIYMYNIGPNISQRCKESPPTNILLLMKIHLFH